MYLGAISQLIPAAFRFSNLYFDATWRLYPHTNYPQVIYLVVVLEYPGAFERIQNGFRYIIQIPLPPVRHKSADHYPEATGVVA
jgi:hypothetical protein